MYPGRKYLPHNPLLWSFWISPVQPDGDKAVIDQKLHHCPCLPSQGAGNDLIAIRDNFIPQNYSALVRQSEYRFAPIGLRISCIVLTFARHHRPFVVFMNHLKRDDPLDPVKRQVDRL